MPGDGPFLWLSERGSPWGYHALPKGGMCISAFLYLQRPDGKVLLGKYADDPKWETLAGLDQTRRRAHGKGWTIPASHMKYGEDPRDSARRIATDILCLPSDLPLSEPRVEVDLGVPARFPDMGPHYDMWFFVDASWPRDEPPTRPPWYAELAFVDPRELKPSDWGRSHDEIMDRWLARKATDGGGTR